MKTEVFTEQQKHTHLPVGELNLHMDVLEHIYSSMLDGVWVIDSQSKNDIQINERFYSNIGFDVEPSDVALKHCVNLEDWHRLCHLIDQLADGSVSEIKLNIQFRHNTTGGTIWMMCRGSKLSNDEVGSGPIVLIFQNITLLKQTESSRKEKSDDLFKINDLFSLQNQDLQEFACALSHDLRQPLRATRYYLNYLVDQSEQVAADETASYLSEALQGTARIKQLIDDVVTYTRSSSSALQTAPTDLRECIQWSIDHTPGLEASQIALFDGDFPVCELDENLMRQLFEHIFSNAVQFKKENVPLQVKITGRLLSGFSEISISDNGIGISQEDSNRIFNLFSRLHSIDEYDGSGLGLATCQRIVERHGGSIKLGANSQYGANFILMLPVISRIEAN